MNHGEQLTPERLAEIVEGHKIWFKCPDTYEDNEIHMLLLHVKAQQIEIDKLRTLASKLAEQLTWDFNPRPVIDTGRDDLLEEARAAGVLA